MRRQQKDGTIIYSSRWVGVFLILLGIWCLAAGLGCLLLDAFAVVLMGLPSMFLAAIAGLSGVAAYGTRFELTHDRLRISAPSWRATPMPPFQKLDIPWTEVRAVQCRQEWYKVPLPMCATVFRIQTDSQSLIYGGRGLMEIVQAMEEIAERAETSIQSEPDVSPGMLKTLFYGPPDWPDASSNADS